MSQNESTFKSFSIAIITSVITAILTSIISYYIWIKQNSIQQEQEIYKYKIQLLENYTRTVTKMISLGEHKDRIRIQYLKTAFRMEDSLKIGRLNLPSKYAYEINECLKKKYPSEFSKFEEALSFDDELSTNTILVHAFFIGDSIYKNTNDVEMSFNDKIIQKFMIDEVKKNKIDVQQIDDVKIIRELANYRWKSMIKTLNFMYLEIDPLNR